MVNTVVKAAEEPYRQEREELTRKAVIAQKQRAQELAAQQAERAAYEREHAHEQSRGWGMSR